MQLVIEGGHPLNGEVWVSGMKNSALPIIYATILVKDECVIHNVPNVSDVLNSLEILRKMGASAEFKEKNTLVINTKDLKSEIKGYDLISKMRASYYLVGAQLGRYGKAHVGYPGGCDFGTRPIDQHLKCFTALGATAGVNSGYIDAEAPNGLVGTHIFFDVVLLC